MVHRVDGKVVKIEGDPRNPETYGHVCAKGNSGFFNRATPYRVTTPMKRTNPKKGLNEDPMWQPISWDEALDTIAKRLIDIHKKNPKLLDVRQFDLWSRGDILEPWVQAFGTEAKAFSAGFYCGNNVHNVHLATEGAHEANPDSKYSKYILLFGSQFGSIVNTEVMMAAHEISGKRPGGVKVVAIDPVGSYAAAKAEEWLPILPGTDAALALGFINLLLNEYKIYDAKFLKERTNAPYLIGKDELYVRDPKTNKPLVWDSVEGNAKTWDQPVGDYALEGTFTVNGQECQPAFQKLKDHVQRYTPEMVSQITTIEPDVIRRIAKEFGEAANIGATVNINGKELPLRPASISYYRGLSAHKHAMLSGLAVETLQVIIGGIDVPGGLVGTRLSPASATDDGLLTIFGKTTVLEGGHYYPMYPPRQVRRPDSVDLLELLPCAVYSRPFFVKSVLEPEAMKPGPLPEMTIQLRTNFVKTSVFDFEQFLIKGPFLVSISLELDETAQMSDMVLPDIHYLERLSLGSSDHKNEGSEPWSFHGQQPIVKAPISAPWGDYVNIGQIFIELARRCGFEGELNDAINRTWGLDEKHRLSRDRSYTIEEMIELRIKSKLGDEYNLEWFKKDGLVLREKPVEQMYRGAFPGPRVHIYFEFLKRAGKEVERVTKEMGIKWDVSDYQVLPDWKPCNAHSKRNEKFDLIMTNFKVPQQAFTFSASNSMLRKLARIRRADDIWMNTETASKKGLNDGDQVVIETLYGKTVPATVRVTELVHPEVIATVGDAGSFAEGRRRGVGVNFNALVSLAEDNVDYVTAAIDSHIPVSITKAPAEEAS
jgi:anaerobic selenocysteine-containing dehydrogenase